jgi:hypothetical protein
MPRVAGNTLALAATLCAAALALVSCGGGSDAKLLPGETAQEISENLDSVQRLVDEGECIAAEDAALQVSTQVETLQGIDAELKRVLEDGAERLNEVVDTCEANLAEDTVEETLPETTETTEEKPEKKEKKPEKVEPEETLPEEEEETEPEKELPPQAKGKAKGHEKDEPPPVEEEGEEPSGGIGPGSATEDDD